MTTLSCPERCGPGPQFGPHEILACSAARFPDKVALVSGTVRLTYRQLDEQTAVVAAALQARGICPGDVVSIYGQNSWQWIVAYHGILRAGAVVNPVNVMLTVPELVHVLTDCGSKALFVGADKSALALRATESAAQVAMLCTLDSTEQDPSLPGLATLLDEGAGAPPQRFDVDRAELCSIAYTSGTTGHPKGAMQSYQAILLNCALTATMHGRTGDDTIVTALPAPHVYGNVAINSTFLVGGTVVLMERFDAARALSLIAEEHATMFEGVPTMYALMLADPAIDRAQLRGLRACTVGGQTLPAATYQAWVERSGAPLLELWGMTEIAGLGITHSVHAPAVPGSIGVTLPGFEARVVPLDNEPHAAGFAGKSAPPIPGELQVRGPLVMLGYLSRPEDTAEVIDADGWLRTGDVAYCDESGHYFVVDRVKDMILTAGYNIYPAEIERVVGAHPDVSMVAVGRRADDVRGEIAVAFVVTKPGAVVTKQSIMDHCADRLAAYKRPRDVVFVDALPVTSSGKVMRRKLGELDTPSGVANLARQPVPNS